MYEVVNREHFVAIIHFSDAMAQGAVTTRQQDENAGGIELRLSNVRKLHSIYLAFAQELHLGEPPAKSLASIAAGTDPQAVKALEEWMDAIDAKIQARELRLALQNTKLATSEPGMHALLARYLGKEMKAVADKAKIDFLLAQYFAFSAPTALHNRPVSFADVAGVLQPIIGPFPVQRSHWVDDIEKLVQELGKANSLRDVRERGIIERGRTIKAQMGEEFARPEHLIACTWLNYLLRRRCSELMKLDLRDIDASLQKLAQRGVSSLDCAAAQMAKAEPIAKLRETCCTWAPPTGSDYAAAPPFTRVLALLSIVDEALQKSEQASATKVAAAHGVPIPDTPATMATSSAGGAQQQSHEGSTHAAIPHTQQSGAVHEEYEQLSSDLLDLKADFRAVVERLRESMGEQTEKLREENKQVLDGLAELKDEQARVSSELGELKTEYSAVAERLCELEAEVQVQAAGKPQPGADRPHAASAQPKRMASESSQLHSQVAELKSEYHAVVERVCELEAQLQTLGNSFSNLAAKQIEAPKINTKPGAAAQAPATAQARPPASPARPAGEVNKAAAPQKPVAKQVPKPAPAAAPPAPAVAKAPETQTAKAGETTKAAPTPKVESRPSLGAAQPQAQPQQPQQPKTGGDFNSEIHGREEQLGSALGAIESLKRRVVASNLKLNGVTVFLTASEIRAFLEEPTAVSQLVRAGVAARYYLAEAAKAAEKSGRFEGLEHLLEGIKEILAALQAGAAAGADAEALMETSKLLNKNLNQANELLARMKAPKPTAEVAASNQPS